MSTAGATTVSDTAAGPRGDDGGAQWEWQEHGMEGVAQGTGENGECGGRGPCY